MPKKFFDEETQKRLVYTQPIDEEVNDTGRWSDFVTTIVRDDDGALYAIGWERGLTEHQEDLFFEGEFPQVFPVDTVAVEQRTEYVEKLEDKDGFAQDILFAQVFDEDLKSIADNILSFDVDDIRARILSLEKLELFGSFGDVKLYQKVAVEFLDKIAALQEQLRRHQ